MTTGIKRVAVAWACAGALLLAWSGMAAGLNAGSDESYDDRRNAALKEQQFWSIVAGEQGAPPGVFGKLATDLKNTPDDELDDFRGDSNRYGGITDELGFDPFNGTDCSECGPLDQYVINTVIDIRSGRLTVVLEGLEPEPASNVGGAPFWIWTLWFVSGPAVVGGMYVRNARAYERQYREYGQEMELVRLLDEAIPEADWREASDLVALRDRLRESVDLRIKYGEEASRTMKMQELRREAQETLDALAVGNRELER
jgi:hypothetical protein